MAGANTGSAGVQQTAREVISPVTESKEQKSE